MKIKNDAIYHSLAINFSAKKLFKAISATKNNKFSKK